MHMPKIYSSSVKNCVKVLARFSPQNFSIVTLAVVMLSFLTKENTT